MSDGSLSRDEVDAILASVGNEKSGLDVYLESLNPTKQAEDASWDYADDERKIDLNQIPPSRKKNPLPLYMQGKEKLERHNYSDEEIITAVTEDMKNTIGVRQHCENLADLQQEKKELEI